MRTHVQTHAHTQAGMHAHRDRAKKTGNHRWRNFNDNKNDILKLCECGGCCSFINSSCGSQTYLPCISPCIPHLPSLTRLTHPPPTLPTLRLGQGRSKVSIVFKSRVPVASHSCVPAPIFPLCSRPSLSSMFYRKVLCLSELSFCKPCTPVLLPSGHNIPSSQTLVMGQ